MNLRAFFSGDVDPRVNRRLIVLRAISTLLAIGWLLVAVVTARSGRAFISSSRSSIPGRTVTWESDPGSFVMTIVMNLVLGLGLIAGLTFVLDGLIRSTRGGGSGGGRPFFRKKYPH